MDEFFVKQALMLAKKGWGWTNPNPMVGAVIVKKGRVIGKGFHRRVGLNHAETEALNATIENPKGATLYVNLEPCATFGRTPPCTKTLIKSGLKRVVCCNLDPNIKTHGKGLAALKAAGIETAVGVLEKEGRRLNETFFTFHEKKRPFVALKFAASLDGKMATRTGDSKWITSEKARSFARELRAEYQGLLVGINTVLADNPNLGTRLVNRKDPVRIIIDPRLQIPLNADVLRDTNVIVATTSVNKTKRKLLESLGVTILTFDNPKISVPELLTALREKEIISVLLEGGGETLGSFIDTKIIDKVYAFHAPILIGGGKARSIGGKGAETIKGALRLKDTLLKRFDDNFLTIGYL